MMAREVGHAEKVVKATKGRLISRPTTSMSRALIRQPKEVDYIARLPSISETWTRPSSEAETTEAQVENLRSPWSSPRSLYFLEGPRATIDRICLGITCRRPLPGDAAPPPSRRSVHRGFDTPLLGRPRRRWTKRSVDIKCAAAKIASIFKLAGGE
jgi:hypothetical protein